MAKMTEEQEYIVHTPGHLAVTAVPGSGKTTTALNKVQHIIANQPNAKAVMVLFGRDPAKEIEGRAIQKGINMNAFRCGTFHSLSLKHLKKHGFKGKIIKQSETYVFSSDAWKKTGRPGREDEVLSTISKMKYLDTLGFGLEDFDEPSIQMYKHYQKCLKAYNLIDFDDILMECTQQIVQEVIPPISMTHLVVDEFQDVDRIQLGWVLAHIKFQGPDVVVIGDDDQSIYGFRSALGMDAFKQFIKVTDAQVVPLSLNFRSPQPILDIADILIRRNLHRIEKQLVGFFKEGAGPRIHLFDDKMEEADHLVDYLRQLPPDSTCAVLARRNDILKVLSSYLRDSNIPHIRLGGKVLWDFPGPSLLYGLLDSTQMNPDLGVSMMANWKGKEDASQFTDTHMQWRSTLRQKNYDQLIRDVASWIRNNQDSALSKKQIESSNTMVIQAENIALGLNGSWGQRANFISEKKAKRTAPITLMTLHQSKGMEFDYVWICQVNQGTIPPNEIDEMELEEERRLMYVGLTRTQKEVVVSSFGEPSVFIEEMLDEENYVVPPNVDELCV